MFAVAIKVRNWQNRYLPVDKQGEEVECMALVDSGAAELALPAEIIDQLRLEQLGVVQVHATRIEISASETVTFCRRATYPRTNGKTQS